MNYVDKVWSFKVMENHYKKRKIIISVSLKERVPVQYRVDPVVEY